MDRFPKVINVRKSKVTLLFLITCNSNKVKNAVLGRLEGQTETNIHRVASLLKAQFFKW